MCGLGCLIIVSSVWISSAEGITSNNNELDEKGTRSVHEQTKNVDWMQSPSPSYVHCAFRNRSRHHGFHEMLNPIKNGGYNIMFVKDPGYTPDEKYSFTTKVIFTSAMLFTFLVSVMGNTFVIYVITKHRSMRTSTNCLIMNLAICDLLISVLQTPSFVKSLHTGDTWFGGTLGNVTCKILSYVGSVLLYCSIFNLVAIATDRYLAVTRPLTYKLSSKWVVIIGIPAMWLISALLSVESVLTPILLYYEHQKMPLCEFDRSSIEVYSLLCCLVVSFIVLIVLYSLICYRLWRRNVPGEVSNNQQALAIRTARKVTVLMISIVIVFVVSWAPVFYAMLAVLILGEFRDISSIFHHPMVFAMSFWLILNSSACNPCLYFIFIENFRHSLKTTCSCLRRPVPEPRSCCIGQGRQIENAESMRNCRQTLDSLVQEDEAVELTAYSSVNHRVSPPEISAQPTRVPDYLGGECV